MCTDPSKPPPGAAAWQRVQNGPTMNYSTMVLGKLPVHTARKALLEILGDEDVDWRTCTETDCLHPCFGPLHASPCNKCYKTWVKTKGQLEHYTCSKCDTEYEEWTEPHIMSFEEKMVDIGKEHLLQ